MSGFDKNTGWCHFTPQKWRRYYRVIESGPQVIEDRFIKSDIPYYFDRSGGLHAKCTDGEMWTILSGRENTFSSETAKINQLQPEYLLISDIGINFDPELSGIKVNKILSEMGFQTRLDGAWEATQKGKDLSIQFLSTDSRYGNKPYLKWSFEIIHIIKTSLQEKT
ncbi:hypothetical protein [Desulfoluna spongiiphila]|uniref:Uncharacterized protein n=1 Tax=Desulfoluna spongiiphila TaxID=419481 RepID=A0A1G5FZI5_9BACT|nr:hypothetical protein [Desulfoluna spongiiphila]SCY44517.1 hypothetical protein SAMN05216233_10999 [Desulfoluna spongiiphila]